MDLIALGEKSWLDLYEKLGVKPLEVAYEEFTTSDGYEQALYVACSGISTLTTR